MSANQLSRAARVAAVLTLAVATAAGAQSVTPAAGYIYSALMLSDTTQSCVAAGPGGTFVALGPGFTGGAQSIAFVTEGGGEHTVASGFNAVSDCVYDAAADVLYVGDNALEAGGAVTGDTVFAIPSASTAAGLSAVGLELVPAGSIPSAFSLALDAAGDLYVSDATGGGNGSVQKISGGVLSPFIASSFDFTGGLAFEGDGSLLVAESLDSFDTQVSRYDSSGTFVEVVSGPGFDHGSFDLDFDLDGNVLVTGQFGGDVVSLDPSDGSAAPFASGFSFATSIEVNAFTGRVELVSSTFVGDDEDFRLHRLTPVARLVAEKEPIQGGKLARECLTETYGVELVASKPGKPVKKAICVDGDPCDADATANDVCLFPVGFCVNVEDPDLPACTPAGLAAFELKKSKPESPSLAAAAAALQAAAPLAVSTCAFSDGVAVPLKISASGARKRGKGTVKVKATSDDAKPIKDSDTVKLVCEPS